MPGFFGPRIAKVSKATKKKAEQYVVENIDEPSSRAYLKGLGQSSFGRIRVNTLVKQGTIKKLKKLYPFM